MGLLEYLLGLTWLLSAVSTLGNSNVVTGTGFYSDASFITYAVVFALLGLAIIYAKARSLCRMRKNALMVSYLVTIFTFILDFVLTGLHWSVIDSVIVGAVSALLWLRLKMDTEYTTAEEYVVQSEHEENKSSNAKHKL